MVRSYIQIVCRCLFPVGFLMKMYAFPILPTRLTCPAQAVLLDSLIPRILVSGYTLCSFTLCFLLHRLIGPSLFLLSALFPYTGRLSFFPLDQRFLTFVLYHGGTTKIFFVYPEEFLPHKLTDGWWRRKKRGERRQLVA
jgi:hypothetical protein